LALDDAFGHLAADAAAQDAITTPSRVPAREINGLRRNLPEGHIEPIIRMSRTMPLKGCGSKLTFVLLNFDSDSEHRPQAAKNMVRALNTVRPQLVARGFTTRL
jgi:hypothetical protein